MTVSELIRQLQDIERDGGGGKEVYGEYFSYDAPYCRRGSMQHVPSDVVTVDEQGDVCIHERDHRSI